MKKINEVIRVVMRNLASIEVDRQPRNTVKTRLPVEARHLAHKQVAKALAKWSG